MKTAINVLLMLLLAACASNPNHETQLTRRIRDDAVRGSEALRAGDYQLIADQTYPPLIAALGGRQKAIATMKAAMREASVKGITQIAFDFGEPTQPIASGGSLYSVLPETITMTAPEKHLRITQKSFMLAISKDNGTTWTFIDGSTVTPDSLPQLIPSLPPSLPIPKAEAPIVERYG